MKTVKLKMVAFVLFMAAGFIACDKDDDAPQIITKKTLVTNVTGAETGSVNQEIALNVTFKIDNTCGAFNKVIEKTTGKTTTIEVEAKYIGSNCGTTPSTKKVIYKFKAATAGTYILKFKKSDTEFITHTIVIS